MSGSGRNWIFRISNPATPNDDPVTWEGAWKHLTYCVWQKEKSASGLVHYQVRCRSTRPLIFEKYLIFCTFTNMR